MPRDSQGNFTNLYNWVEDEANGIGIEADRHQGGDDDQATGLTDSLDRNGRGGMKADLAMGNNKVTQVNEGTAAADAAPISQLQTAPYTVGTDTGTANTYKIALSPAITAYTEGLRVRFYAGNTNTGASTLEVNSVVPAPPIQWAGKDLVADTIKAGVLVEADYDGNAFQIINVPEVLPTAYGGTGRTTAPDITEKQVVYTASGTFDKSQIGSGVVNVKVVTKGAGGGGQAVNGTGAGQYSVGGGGGEGGEAVKIIEVSALAATETVTVGTGAVNVDGGNSSFGTFCTGEGGKAGTIRANSSNIGGAVGGRGGGATGGDTNIQGAPGQAGIAAPDATVGGSGGGRGGGLGAVNSGLGENAQENSGAGGGGAGNNENQISQNGGKGADGYVIVEWTEVSY